MVSWLTSTATAEAELNSFLLHSLEMEISVFGNGFHHHVLRTSLHTHFSVMASAPHAVPKLKNHRPNSIAVVPKQPQVIPDSANSKVFNRGQKRHSKSYLERQSAIDQVKDCSELASALVRFFFWFFAVCIWSLNCGNSLDSSFTGFDDVSP